MLKSHKPSNFVMHDTWETIEKIEKKGWPLTSPNPNYILCPINERDTWPPPPIHMQKPTPQGPQNCHTQHSCTHHQTTLQANKNLLGSTP